MIITLLALFIPRIVALYLWLFTPWFYGVFQTSLWPLLGFLFMPYTLLWYSAVMHWYGSVWGGFQILILLIAIMCDLSSNKSAY